MSKVPSMSSKELCKLLKRGGAKFARQSRTDHAIYFRIVEGKRYSAPIQMGKKTLDPIYCKRVLRQSKSEEVGHFLDYIGNYRLSGD